MNKISLATLVATLLILLVCLFSLQKLNKHIQESNKKLQDLTEAVSSSKNGTNPSKQLDIDDPHEHPRFIAVTANISTEINRGQTGNIDLENYWPFTNQISDVEIKLNSLNSINSLPTSVPPVQQLSLQNLQSYNGSAGNIAVIGSQQRYIELQAAANESLGVQLFEFEFQVKYTSCDCWSGYQNGYLSITVR